MCQNDSLAIVLFDARPETYFDETGYIIVYDVVIGLMSGLF